MRQVMQQQGIQPRARQKSTEQKAARNNSESKSAQDNSSHEGRRSSRPLEQALARAAHTTQRDLLQALEILQRENLELRAQLRIDHLTGVFNRFALVDELEGERLRSLRSSRNAALLLIDLNDFKRINDTYGHTVGDQSLICVADYFAAQLRATDLVARLGGDEFAILLRDTDGAEAQRVAAKLCASAPRLALAPSTDAGDSLQPSSLQFDYLQLNFAIGVAELTARVDSVQAWLDAADQAMYRHKRGAVLHLCRE